MSSNRKSRVAPGFSPASFGLVTAALVAAATVVFGAGQKFYPDDPIKVDDDKALDASGVKPREDANGWDYFSNTFMTTGEKVDVPAKNTNTLDEVPDSSWFTNRIGQRPMPMDELVKGPDRFDKVSLDGWQIIRDKGTGAQPGFRMIDPSGHLYQIEFDPPSNPEMASGVETIGTAFYHAFGYHVVDVYITTFDPAKMVISERATIRDPYASKRRPMTREDVEAVLRRGAQNADGTYRVLASRFADGAPVGNFRYYSTRPDDPNDIVPHEHRRELRGNRVFAAWLNHDDSRGVNSLDMLEETSGKKWVKHYMFDFGSILGSGTVYAQRPRPGNEYIFEAKPGWATLATLGLYVRPWALVDYPKEPRAVGAIEADFFEPEKWKPEYPNAAFVNMRPEDAFWAARIVAKFNDEMVRAIVGKAKFTDPAATQYLTDVILKRREKVLRTWMNQVNPVVDFALDGSGRLKFANAAVDAGAAKPATNYQVQWFRFDNATSTKTPVGSEAQITSLTADAPPELIKGSDQYIGVTIKGTNPEHPGWSRPATVYLRRASGSWETVGIER